MRRSRGHCHDTVTFAPGLQRAVLRMRIEAFSEGKDLDAPRANEDQFLALPGRGYAVIDGVTDISGRLYDGMRAGRLASGVVQRAVAKFLADPAEAEMPPERLIARVSADLRAAYERHGMLDAARADPSRRFGATLTLAVDLGAAFRFILIGDSGVRLNGAELSVVDSGLDLVTATLRRLAFRVVAEAGGGLEDRRRVGRACAFHGGAKLHPEMLPWLDDAQRAALYEDSLRECRRLLPGVPEADLRHLLDTGISGQGRFQNNTISKLSYAVLDGFDIPMSLIQVFDRPRASIESIELFTDGYFKPGAAPAVAAWEAAFAEVERVDPEKIGRYPSVKGTVGRLRTDDRTVVVVNLS